LQKSFKLIPNNYCWIDSFPSTRQYPLALSDRLTMTITRLK